MTSTNIDYDDDDDDDGLDADGRPAPKTELLALRANQKHIAKAKARAKKEGRSLIDVIRAFVFGYGEDEYPAPPKLPGEGRRAKKQSKKKK